MSAPKDAKKADLYSFIDNIADVKRKEVKEKYNKIVKEKGYAEQIVKSLEQDVIDLKGAIKNLEKIAENKFLMGKIDVNSIAYYIRQLLYHNESKELSSVVKEKIYKEYDHASTFDKVIDESNSEIVKSAKKFSNSIRLEFSKELESIKVLQRELRSVVSSASRGSDAWNKLEKVGFDLTELRSQLMRSGSISLPAVMKTSVDIDLFNKVKLGKEKEDAADKKPS